MPSSMLFWLPVASSQSKRDQKLDDALRCFTAKSSSLVTRMSKNAQENGKIKRIKEAVKEEKDAIQKFPMLKLPDLVRETVIRLMDPVEIFDFSQISKRMHRTAKRSVRHNTYHLHLQAGQLYQAALYPPTYPEVPAEPARFRVQQLDDDTARAPTNVRKLGNFQKIRCHFQESGLYFFHKSHWIILGALPKMVYAHLELKRTYDRDVICQDIPMIQENSERLFSRYTLHADIGGFHFNLVNGDLGSIFFYNNAEAGMLSTDVADGRKPWKNEFHMKYTSFSLKSRKMKLDKSDFIDGRIWD
ncbi:hypothetical protein L3Y34_013153 [Caenorhabditis briggsae]|uniref:F-box domain-containing protein n=1 Tax=Caenorhabditis briggsae TaxID=6238 RepID=A0AAE9CWQ4_CAEBR|nr:hypothetical protein L3Y34_013153 [Caenorhabditis briggsae]